MSLRGAWSLLMAPTVAVALGLLAAFPAVAQYPGQVAKNTKESPELRSIAVLEWTGDLAKPKASRLVPVAVLDGGILEDGGIYLARPQPLALSGEVEYELDQDGEPVLHRKHHADDRPASGKGGGGADSGSGSASSAPPADSDPDRPTLHRAPSAGSGTATSGTASPGTASPGTASTAGTPGASSTSDEPTLHRKDSSSDSSAAGSSPTSASAPPDDPDRPVLKKSKKKEKTPEDVGHVDSVPDDTDPDRPKLKRGRSNADSLGVNPSLMGMPADMEQAVAVSDSKTHPEHPWDFTWSDPADADKMKSALEDMARDALGLKPPPPPAPKKTGTARTATRKTAKPAAPAPAPEPVPLEGEKFRVFELAYGSGATLVLSAHTSGPLAQQKFVTLVAQPDLYGNVLVLLKSVTDGKHLDETPRMRLVDAVDALADNRGELLFELRGATERQFALYRVLRGRAEKMFVSGGADFGIESSE